MKRITLIFCLSLMGMLIGGDASAHHSEADCPLIFSACSIQFWDHTNNVCVNKNEPTTKSCETSSTCLNAAFCDGAGSCDNTSAVSFVERAKPNVMCAPAVLGCETPSMCEYVGGGGGPFDIVGYECGPHRPLASPKVCRPSTGTCDAAESCTGQSRFCPGDEPALATTLCRPSAGACDVADFCDGESYDCPTAVLPEGETCRDIENQCDLGETCDGVSPFCPEDELADAIACDDGDECTDNDTCTQGQCVGDGIDSCPADEPDGGDDETPEEDTEPETPDADETGDSDEEDAMEAGGGGCSLASQSSSAGWLPLFLIAFVWTRRRRRSLPKSSELV